MARYAGDGMLAAKGTRHRPVAAQPAHALMLERPETRQYGNWQRNGGGVYFEAACQLVLCGFHIVRGAQAVERGLEDWFEVAGVAVDRGDGDD